VTGALGAVRARPWHLLLGALVAGLLAGPFGVRALVLAAAVLAALAGRPGVALVAIALVVAGGAVAVARLHALDRTELRPLLGADVTRQVVLLEPPRPARFDTTALARLRGGQGGGEKVLLRLHGSPPDVGSVLRVEGKLRALSPYESYQRRHGAHATLVARTWPPRRDRRGHRRRAPPCRARSGLGARPAASGAHARHGPRPGPGAERSGPAGLPALGSRSSARRQR
jgi:hypothetical protein